MPPALLQRLPLLTAILLAAFFALTTARGQSDTTVMLIASSVVMFACCWASAVHLLGAGDVELLRDPHPRAELLLPVALRDLYGFLVERKDVEDLTEKIELLMNNPTLRRELGKNSRSLYEKEFQLDKMVDKTLAVYQSILQ